MPLNKSAFLRYRVIDSCLTNPYRRFPDTDFIISKIEEQIGAGISRSMFGKDLQQMREIYGAPIKFNRQRNGYFYDQENYTIRDMPLTSVEMEALDLSTALLQQLKGTQLFRQFDNAINKVIEGYRLVNIIGKSPDEIIQVEEPVHVDCGPWLEVLLKAIMEKKTLSVTYKGFGRDPNMHDISPYLMKEYRNRWYLIGHSYKRNKVIVMALDRITDITGSVRQFHSGEFMADDFFRHSVGITAYPGTFPEKVILSFSRSQAPYVLSQPIHSSQQTVKESKDELQISLNVYITAELKMIILSYGPEVKVLEPLSLRKEISNAIRMMQENYL
jgi:predicted DNA-binding transcriptional regulator YafY